MMNKIDIKDELSTTRKQRDALRLKVARQDDVIQAVQQWLANDAEWTLHNSKCNNCPCDRCESFFSIDEQLRVNLADRLREILAIPPQDQDTKDDLYRDPSHKHRWAISHIHAAFGCIDCDASYFDWSQNEIAGLRAGIEIIRVNNDEILEYLNKTTEIMTKAVG